MSEKQCYEVIVVGAGPAGAILGYELARMGIEVAILEKERLPRYKPCGGGVTIKAANLLGFDIKPVVEAEIYGVVITHNFQNKFTRYYSAPITYMVMRDKFDHFLVEKARGAGATIFEGQKVNKVEMGPEQVEVSTIDSTFIGQIIVGADGAHSMVAKALDLMRKVPLNVAIESEVSIPRANMAIWDGLISLDLGSLPNGYSWVFPKEDHLSIGVGGPKEVARGGRLKHHYKEFLLHQKDNLGDYQILKYTAHPLPLRRVGMAIHRDRGLLVGDAAGLIDALSGEGIYYAIRSAQLAASAIQKSLTGGKVNLQNYEKAIDKQLMPELSTAKIFLRIFNWFPGLFLKLLRENDGFWQAAARVSRGEKTYVSIKKGLGPFEFFLDFMGIGII